MGSTAFSHTVSSGTWRRTILLARRKQPTCCTSIQLAAPCAGVVRGREDRDPDARQQGSYSAAVAGRVERHGFEYVRHGMLSLYAVVNTQTGEVIGKTAPRNTTQEFVAFLTDIVVKQPKTGEIHIVLDNLSAHKTRRAQDFLEAHANVQLHFTPTCSSWLNQVELWFAKLERDLIYRGVLTSMENLARGIMKFIRRYNEDARPFKWKYDDPSRRVSVA